MQKQSSICTTYRRGSRDVAPLIVTALGGRFGCLLHALATLPQVKISCYPACLDKWRREKSLTPTGHGPDSTQSSCQLNYPSSSHIMHKLFLILIICCMKQMKGNLCASLAFTLFTLQNLFWSWLKLMVWSSQDSSDAIVTNLDDLGFESKQGPQSLSSLKPPRLTDRPHQAFYALGTGGSTGDRMAWVGGWWLTFI